MINRACGIGGIAAAAVLALAAGGAQAAPGLPAPENSLLGIRLMARFADVLKRFGQPHEIQVGGGHSAPVTGVPTDLGGAGDLSGAMQLGTQLGQRMLGQYGGLGNGGAARSMMGGRGSRGDLGAASEDEGGVPSVPNQMNLGNSHRNGFGGGRPQGMGGSVLPGFNSNPGIPGLPSVGPGGALEPQVEDQTYSETTWWYNFPRLGLHFSFLFNKDGRVIQIQEYGWKMGKWCTTTRQGIGLGSALGQVIRRYGWSNDGERSEGNLTLRYGGEHRLAFQVVKNSVAGITLAMGE